MWASLNDVYEMEVNIALLSVCYNEDYIEI